RTLRGQSWRGVEGTIVGTNTGTNHPPIAGQCPGPNVVANHPAAKHPETPWLGTWPNCDAAITNRRRPRVLTPTDTPQPAASGTLLAGRFHRVKPTDGTASSGYWLRS